MQVQAGLQQTSNLDCDEQHWIPLDACRCKLPVDVLAWLNLGILLGCAYASVRALLGERSICLPDTLAAFPFVSGLSALCTGAGAIRQSCVHNTTAGAA